MMMEAGAEVSGPAAQMSYARGLITLEQRNRVLNIMKRFRLPLWHVVCHPSLFWKVRLAPAHDCCPPALVLTVVIARLLACVNSILCLLLTNLHGVPSSHDILTLLIELPCKLSN